MSVIWKNLEIFNVDEIYENENGSISWRRIPQELMQAVEREGARMQAVRCTGVELRFVMKSERVVLRMRVRAGNGVLHVYRGGIQGGWQDHESGKIVSMQETDIVIDRSANMERLKVVTQKCGLPWDCEVVRVIFDRGEYELFDVIGEIEPPKKEQCPDRMLMSYGSSITHGSNSYDASHSWVAMIAHNLGMDAMNKGFAGSCCLEPEMADYLASAGEKGIWDVITLELGINVLDWEEAQILTRTENMIRQVAGRNPDKPVFVISPFYYYGDDFGEKKSAAKWRRLIEQVVRKLAYENVTYINGLDIIGDASTMSADEVHPNIYGVQQIAERLTGIIGERIGQKK